VKLHAGLRRFGLLACRDELIEELPTDSPDISLHLIKEFGLFERPRQASPAEIHLRKEEVGFVKAVAAVS